MTAPAAPTVPTPADLAPRPPATAPKREPKGKARPRTAKQGQPYQPRTLSPEEAIRPGKLTAQEHFRKVFLYGLRTSGMPPHARLVGHDLLSRANHATGRISARRQPSSERLAFATGLTAAQVDVALQVLLTRGWLQPHRVTEGPRTGQTVHCLAVPAAALERVRAWISTHPLESVR
ncbi:hypothetical protein ACIOC2_01300 [Streptomyces sp. NPDC088337]|uniref:hypothetical protein n=1 Tax=unclassified Streptomyces TaxID=2593676 RepID=UPI00381A608A